MKPIRVAYLVAALIVLPLLTMAQTENSIEIAFPTNRAVFQRNNANRAALRISGFYKVPLNRIEAKLTPLDGQSSNFRDWQTIQDNPSGGIFNGSINDVAGGWYVLEVRGKNGDQVVGNRTVDRVGVGEVFIVAGQSNAQGENINGAYPNAPDSNDDRVNCLNYKYAPGRTDDPPIPQSFDRLSNNVTLAPRGTGSWCWGRLGDLLVSRYNVPVMFFNAAYSGTSSQNWRESASGNVTTGPGGFYEPGQPYINLKLSLQFYINTFGVRAVLWHQGEADAVNGMDANSYANNLRFVIDKSRQDANKNIAWVVARASYNRGTISSQVIEGQNQVISTAPNTFAGPFTDDIQNRPDNLHFGFEGLVTLANAWNNSLSDDFFQSSAPQSPAGIPNISVTCATDNKLTFSVNGDYSFVQWESGELTKVLTTGQGTYRAKIKDGAGNTVYGYARVANAPTVTTIDNRPPSVCIGSSLALNANYENNVTWINQQNNTTVASGRTFNTTAAGNYYVRYRDVSGCDFQSNVVPVTVNPLPPTPQITNDKPTTFCERDNTVLRTNAANIRYNWSDGQQGQSVTVGKSGDYFLTVTDQNGCTSDRSNTIPVVVNLLPTKPVIALSGPTTFCADQSITLTAPEEASYTWSGGETTRSLTINQPGSFSVRTRSQFGCLSDQSDVVTTRVNPLPETPAIAALGSTTFCDGGRVTLTSESPLNVVWPGELTTKSIEVTRTGDYVVRSRDQNGCLSPPSRAINVTVNPLPSAPRLLSNREPTLCEGDQITFTVDGPFTVFWSTGDSTKSITTGEAGNYSARIRDVNGCVSPQSNPTVVELRPLPPPPSINVVGTYTLEAVNASPLNSDVFRWRRDSDSLTVQTRAIKANQSGTYTARASIAYSPTLTCFSVPSAPITFQVDASNRGLSIYPNPNPDKIVILETLQNLTNATVTVYTLTGQMVYTANVPAFDERKQIILTELPAGTYVLRVKATDFDVAKRILLGL